MNITTFRIDKTVHAISHVGGRVKRDGTHRAFCSAPFGANAQRLAPHEPEKAVPINCERCLRTTLALTDVLETDFGFDPGDRMKRSEK